MVKDFCMCAVSGARIHRLLTSRQDRHRRSHLQCTGVTTWSHQHDTVRTGIFMQIQLQRGGHYARICLSSLLALIM